MKAELNERLSGKLRRIRSGAYKPVDFIIADAKDAEMGGGLGALGSITNNAGSTRPTSAIDYRQSMKRMIGSGLVDIMLTSMSSAESLVAAKAFEGSDVTRAIRLNDATDIWGLRRASYHEHPAVPFRTARLDHARRFAALGLYALTFYDDSERDVATLRAYKEFRIEAEAAGIKHFLDIQSACLFSLATKNWRIH